MAQLVKTELIEEVRRALDEVTLSGEMAIVDTDLEDLASSNFSDDDLGDRLDDSARYVASRVRAQYLPDLVTDITPAQFETTKVLRLLGSRVSVDGVVATRRTRNGHRKLEASGKAASGTNPVYIIEDAEVEVVPSANASIAVVVVPESCEDLTHRLRQAVVQRCLFMCYQTLRLKNMADTSKAAYNLAMQPYRIPVMKLGATNG